jgi:hypothetical protein
MQRKCQWAAFFLFVLASWGCKSVLNVDKEIDVKAGSDSTLLVDPFKKEQTINVVVSSPDAPVEVCVYLEKNQDAAQRDIEQNKKDSSLILARARTKETAPGTPNLSENIELSATIPAGEGAVVQVGVRGGKSAKVKVKITN